MPVIPKKAGGGPHSPGKKGTKVKKAGDEAKLRVGSIISNEDGLYHEPIKNIIKPVDQVCTHKLQLHPHGEGGLTGWNVCLCVL